MSEQTLIYAISKYERISSRKLVRIARCIQGKSVSEAFLILKSLPQKGAYLVFKTLKSASDNAEKNYRYLNSQLRINKILINDGPRFSRYQPRARGRLNKLIKRTSHIRVELVSK